MTRKSDVETASKREQRGISLVLGLIMLILLTLLAISAFQASNVNLAHRRQHAGASGDAGRRANRDRNGVEHTGIHRPDDAAGGRDRCSLNGASYTVDFTPAPACKSVVDIPSEDLVPTNPDDFSCIPSAALPGSSSGIFLASGPPSAPVATARTRAGR